MTIQEPNRCCKNHCVGIFVYYLTLRAFTIARNTSLMRAWICCRSLLKRLLPNFWLNLSGCLCNTNTQMSVHLTHKNQYQPKNQHRALPPPAHQRSASFLKAFSSSLLISLIEGATQSKSSTCIQSSCAASNLTHLCSCPPASYPPRIASRLQASTFIKSLNLFLHLWINVFGVTSHSTVLLLSHSLHG